jgi:hypothetical protein
MGDLEIGNQDYDLVEKLVELITQKENEVERSRASEYENKLPKVKKLISVVNKAQGDLDPGEFQRFVEKLVVGNRDYNDLKGDITTPLDANNILETLTELKEKLEQKKKEITALPNVDVRIESELERFTDPEQLHKNLHDPLLIEAVNEIPSSRWFVDELKGNRYTVVPRGQGPYPERAGEKSFRILDAEAEREKAVKAMNTLKLNVEQAERTGNFPLSPEQAQEILKGPYSKRPVREVSINPVDIDPEGNITDTGVSKKIRMRGVIPELEGRKELSSVVNDIRGAMQALGSVTLVKNPVYEKYLESPINFNSVFFNGLPSKAKDILSSQDLSKDERRALSIKSIEKIDEMIESANNSTEMPVDEKVEYVRDLERFKERFPDLKKRLTNPQGRVIKQGFTLVAPQLANPALDFSEFKKFINYIIMSDKQVRYNRLQMMLEYYEELLAKIQSKIEREGFEYRTPVINKTVVDSSLQDWEEYIQELDSSSRYNWVNV